MLYTLLNLVALSIIVGVGLWLINVYIPMAPMIKSLLNVLVLIVLVIYILQFFNIIHPIFPMVHILKQ